MRGRHHFDATFGEKVMSTKEWVYRPEQGAGLYQELYHSILIVYHINQSL